MNKPSRFPLSELTKRKGLVKRTCPNCHEDFAIRECYTLKCNESYCSKECFEKGGTLAKRYKYKMPTDKKGHYPCNKAVQKILTQDNFYMSHKEEYKEKIIDYADSPTGKAYVGINKTPFMPAADNSHGYQGIVLQDENRLLVQCHGCGQWMRKIAEKHVQSCSGITIKEYKEKYGINSDTGLVSDETSLKLTKACLKNKIQDRKVSGLYKWHHNKERKTYHSMEFFNKYGTCPLQLKTRLYEFIRCNRELPSQGNKGRPIYKALRRRYGSYGHALTAHGLPWMKKQGSTYRFAFSDGTNYKYNVNQFYDREALFNLMMEKCPVLHSL